MYGTYLRAFKHFTHSFVTRFEHPVSCPCIQKDVRMELYSTSQKQHMNAIRRYLRGYPFAGGAAYMSRMVSKGGSFIQSHAGDCDFDWCFIPVSKSSWQRKCNKKKLLKSRKFTFVKSLHASVNRSYIHEVPSRDILSSEFLEIPNC